MQPRVLSEMDYEAKDGQLAKHDKWSYQVDGQREKLKLYMGQQMKLFQQTHIIQAEYFLGSEIGNHTC
jgi:hypothetical protein